MLKLRQLLPFLDHLIFDCCLLSRLRIDLIDIGLACLLSEILALLVVVLVEGAEYVCGLHSTTTLWTQEALDHHSVLQSIVQALVA